MSTPANRTPLVDLLPTGGQFYTDRENEADLIEDLRYGYVTVTTSIPMEDLLPLLRARLGYAGNTAPTPADWAAFRFYLQERVGDYLDTLALRDFEGPGVTLMSAPGEHDDFSDPRALRLAGEQGDDGEDA